MRCLLLVAVLAAASVGAAACAGPPSTSSAEPSPSPALEPLGALGGGDPLPPAELAYLEGDERLRVHELSRPAVINFWASWCTFCVDEMPDFETVHQALGDEVVFVGVNKEDHLDKARRLGTETGVTYELVIDPDGSFFRDVQGRGMPTTLFVDGDGVIVHRHTGPLTAERLRALVEEHLGI